MGHLPLVFDNVKLDAATEKYGMSLAIKSTKDPLSTSPTNSCLVQPLGKDGCVTIWAANRLGMHWISPKVSREVFAMKGAEDSEVAKVQLSISSGPKSTSF